MSLIVVLTYRFFIDRNLVKKLKEEMKDIKERVMEAQIKGDLKEVNKMINEMTKLNATYMKQMIKPMMITTFILILVFPWIKHTYSGKTVVELPFKLPGGGTGLSWIWWYIIVSFTIGWVLRKILGVET